MIDNHTVFISVTDLCDLFKLRCKDLTVSAPRSIEVNDPGFTACQHVTAELCRSQADYVTWEVVKQPGTQRLRVTEPVTVDAVHTDSRQIQTGGLTAGLWVLTNRPT